MAAKVTEYLYTIGAHGNVSKPIPVAEVWVTGPAGVTRAKRAYAKEHGLRESGVWSEARKSPGGPISRPGPTALDADTPTQFEPARD